MTNPIHFEGSMSVNQVLRQTPVSIEVFNALGVDACCGGAASLDEAAREAHTTLDVLVAALEAAAASAGNQYMTP